ncbi:uncharacterized protein TNCV_2506261 [Trichonephila clavipes]|uniref:Uncharacterized protein n=1 Tax=Trichonephila clavipes TaxID=2585209 RepID=A0A8X7BKA2_TRICX|nr:uncharacterized protein TNCV_2506261 [Trichonephila clavipes]
MGFQHDGASAHFSADVRSALDTAYSGRWIGRGGPVNWPTRSPDLSCLDFFVLGHMNSLVYASPVDSDEALVARIAVVAGDIREMTGYLLMFDSPSADGEVVVAAWSTTPSPKTPRSGITEFCSEGREFQISPPEHNSVYAT